jgi:hypothetical protein
MTRLKTGLFAVVTAILIAHAETGAQTPAAFAAYHSVCGQEGAKVIADIQREIRAAQNQAPWTPAQERQRIESDFKEANTAGAEQLARFDDAFQEIWKEATDFIQRPEMILAACAVTVAKSWNAGIRDIPTLKQKWAEARYAKYKIPGSPAVAITTPAAPAAPSAPAAAPPEGSGPVDCVRLGDREGVFKNVCDFPVYFTYCGVNPPPGSWTARCDEQSKWGLDGIAANGIQAGFTRAETIHMFACKKPKTPKDVKFIPGKGLWGTCK